MRIRSLGKGVQSNRDKWHKRYWSTFLHNTSFPLLRVIACHLFSNSHSVIGPFSSKILLFLFLVLFFVICFRIPTHEFSILLLLHQIKDNMISQMAKVKVTDMKNLIQVSSVVAGATEEKTELSQKSKV